MACLYIRYRHFNYWQQIKRIKTTIVNYILEVKNTYQELQGY